MKIKIFLGKGEIWNNRVKCIITSEGMNASAGEAQSMM